MTTAAEHKDRWAAQAERQDRYNAALEAGKPTEELRQEIVEHARTEHGKYPQYDGYFDAWRLITIQRRVSGKGGVRFERGDVTIGTSKPGRVWPAGEVHAYCPRTGWVVVLGTTEARPA